jgi:protein involved in polysaccharide export with SLBB domain
LDQHLRQAVARIYRNFDLSVDVGRTRSMQVYVTGQARRPGVYTISSLSSLVNALFASGGPSAQGSLRHILVNRGGATIADFDLYSLLVHGDKSKDVRLLPEDVLYIPAAGPQVAITGSVRSPAIYELRAGETIADLIETAGKTTAMSSDARISLERVGQRQLRQAMEFKFDAAGLAAPLADGDILRIFPILPLYEKTVTIRGNVANPGRFAWHPGMRLSDLIPDRESLLSRDYWWKRSHLGLPVPEFESTISTLEPDQRSPGSNGPGSQTPISQENLTAALLPNAQQDPYNAATESPRPGQTGNTGSSIASQLAQNSAPGGAGQPRRYDVRLSAPEINWDYAVIERLDPDTLKSSLIPFDLGKLVIDHDAGQDMGLQPGDTITVFSQSDIRVPLDRQTKYVELEGEFVHAGIYSVQPGETLRDIARRAGGLTPKAYLFGAEFTRQSTRLLQQQRIDEYARTVSMEAERGTQALAMSTPSGSGSADVSASRLASQELSTRLSQIRATGRIVLQFHPESAGIDDVPAISLENGDRFVVPFTPSTVNVVGAVYDQNSFLFDHGRSVIHYLQLAGGPNRNADSHHAFVIRADGSVVSRAAVKGASIWTNSFNQIRLNPGDTIVVPDKTLRPSALRGIMDWTQVFSQLALGAAAINVL